MKVLLLLAGRSTRFWPLPDKTLFPICGKTLLQHQIDQLQAAKLIDITLVGGRHNIDAATTLFPDLPTIEQQDLELGMRGALLDALPSCGDTPVLVVSGNDAIAADAYKAVIAAAKNADGALLAKRVSTYFPGGYLTLNGERITGIQEKPGAGNEPSDLVNIVAHVHNHPTALLTTLQQTTSQKDDGYEQAMQLLFTALEYRAVPYDGTWQPVKYPWHLLDLLDIFFADCTKQVVHKTAEIHPSAVLDGPVVIGEGVKMLPHATIRGPAYIGPHTIVANNALVRNASIGEHCVVGYCTEVKNSILHSHVWTHMTYIGDSIIGRNVAFGAGCVTGNFRLDERTISTVIKGEAIDSGRTKFGAVIGSDVRIGIQVGMNPGVKIGSQSFIAGGTYISEDIPAQSFVSMKNGVPTRKENREAIRDPLDRQQYRERVE